MFLLDELLGRSDKNDIISEVSSPYFLFYVYHFL